MKVTVRGTKPEKKEPEMNLFLESYGGGVNVRAEDASGLIWTILQIQSDGRISRARGIKESTGWPLDSEGRLKLSSE